jgi:nitrilase
MPKVAVVQRPPAVLDRGASFRLAADAIAEAAGQGAKLVVFPETFIGGYPDWVWRLRPADFKTAGEIHERLLGASVDLTRDEHRPLCDAAKRAGVTVACGIHERDGEFSRATLYNTLLLVGDDGALLNRHRKLVPTNPERMVWGMGDGSGLRVVDTPAGRVGGLICWENYMPLARFALYAQGVEIYLAPTWDQGETWLATMRHIAREARAWVIGAAICMQARDFPESFPDKATLYPDADEWVNSGDSVVVDPTGKVAAGPMHQEKGILYADCDPARVAVARRTFDPAGHYHRPDVFSFEVNRARQTPASLRDEPR